MKITYRSCVVGCGRDRGEKRWADVRGRFQRLFRCSKGEIEIWGSRGHGEAHGLLHTICCNSQLWWEGKGNKGESSWSQQVRSVRTSREVKGIICSEPETSHFTISFISLSLWQETGCSWMSWRFVSFIKMAHCLKCPDHSLLFHGFRAFLSLSHSARGSRHWHGIMWRK